jgi:acetoacetyl-CoA synthetase
MDSIVEGALLWEPSAALRQDCTLTRYVRELEKQGAEPVSDYNALWLWSVDHIDAFWRSIASFFEVGLSTPYETAIVTGEMPRACWFTGATINYTEQVFRQASATHPALVFKRETGPLVELSWAELERSVAAIAAALRTMGVQVGDMVAGYVPNSPEAVIAFLACASIGAVWSSCSPDMGTAGVTDRFAQIAPKVLFAVDGYRYGGKPFDRTAVLTELRATLPSLTHIILIPYLDPECEGTAVGGATLWPDLMRIESPLQCVQLPFEHPLWVLFSSGTTGLPKPMVQGHGGIVLEHLKLLALHHDLRPGDRFFWLTTTGWMMWNLLVSGLLVGSTVVLYDGSPGFPDLGALWSLAEEADLTLFGAGAAFYASCMKAGLQPGHDHVLSKLRTVGSTGSPLSAEGFQWIYQQVKQDVMLASVSGGTDICGAFVGPCPWLPVYAGVIQCRCLGAAVAALDDQGASLIEEVGELVVTRPMPSMPLYFWNDPGDQRYRESYFEMYPGLWRHGDWIRITRAGGAVIYGRSDATINRQGIRMGTSEIYRVVEQLDEVLDSLVVDLEWLGRESFMPLFVVLRPGQDLDDGLSRKINGTIRHALSPRYVPSRIFAIPEVPRTSSGKKLELPVKRILMGVPIDKAANPDAMSNPASLGWFQALALELGYASKASE